MRPVVFVVCFLSIVQFASFSTELRVPVYTFEASPYVGLTWQTWTVIGFGTGSWKLDGEVVYGRSVDGDSILVSSEEYSDFVFAARVSTTNREASLFFRIQDVAHCYQVVLFPEGSSAGRGGVYLRLRDWQKRDEIARYTEAGWPRLGEKIHVLIVAVGDRIVVAVNGKEVIDIRDSTYRSGKVGLRVYGERDYPCDSWFDRIMIYDLSRR